MPTHEHMEHAEHAEHAAHDPFDRRVALTIAIVAAILASVTVLAHRAHTDTLKLQGEGLAVQSEANALSNETFDKWAEYQARKGRQSQYMESRKIIKLMAVPAEKESEQKKELKDLDEKIATSEKKIKAAMDEAKEFEKKSKDRYGDSQQKMHESHEMHERADRFDLGELFVEVALVLCSIAILTKRKSFWFTGMAICLLGALIAVSGLMGLFMSPSHSAEHHDGQHQEHRHTSGKDAGHDHKPNEKGGGEHH